MFGKLQRLIDNVQNLNVNEVMYSAMQDKVLQSQVLDLNTKNQLYEQGVDALGNSLGEYATATIYGTSNFAGKIEKGQRYDHITLNDTGRFYDSFRFVNEADGFTITADSITDEGTDLTKQYGNKIIGLTSESKAILVEEVKPHVIEVVRKEIFR